MSSLIISQQKIYYSICIVRKWKSIHQIDFCSSICHWISWKAVFHPIWLNETLFGRSDLLTSCFLNVVHSYFVHSILLGGYWQLDSLHLSGFERTILFTISPNYWERFEIYTSGIAHEFQIRPKNSLFLSRCRFWLLHRWLLILICNFRLPLILIYILTTRWDLRWEDMMPQLRRHEPYIRLLIWGTLTVSSQFSKGGGLTKPTGY